MVGYLEGFVGQKVMDEKTFKEPKSTELHEALRELSDEDLRVVMKMICLMNKFGYDPKKAVKMACMIEGVSCQKYMAHLERG